MAGKGHRVPTVPTAADHNGAGAAGRQAWRTETPAVAYRVRAAAAAVDRARAAAVAAGAATAVRAAAAGGNLICVIRTHV